MNKKKSKKLSIQDNVENDNNKSESDDEEPMPVDDNDKDSGDNNDDDVDDDEMDLGNFNPSNENRKVPKKRKKGIIYVSNIPKHMNVTRMREILGEFGKIGRVYLQPERKAGGDKTAKQKKRKKYNIHFTEGWVEFESKRVAKQIVPLLNNKQISSRKKSQFYDSLWSMKYLPRFKWVHLTERMNYEQAVHKQQLQTEVAQARKETTFYQNNLDKSELIAKRAKKQQKQSKQE